MAEYRFLSQSKHFLRREPFRPEDRIDQVKLVRTVGRIIIYFEATFSDGRSDSVAGMHAAHSAVQKSDAMTVIWVAFIGFINIV